MIISILIALLSLAFLVLLLWKRCGFNEMFQWHGHGKGQDPNYTWVTRLKHKGMCSIVGNCWAYMIDPIPGLLRTIWSAKEVQKASISLRRMRQAKWYQRKETLAPVVAVSHRRPQIEEDGKFKCLSLMWPAAGDRNTPAITTTRSTDRTWQRSYLLL